MPPAPDRVEEARELLGHLKRASGFRRLPYDCLVLVDDLFGTLDRIQQERDQRLRADLAAMAWADNRVQRLTQICQTVLAKLETVLSTARYEGGSTDQVVSADLLPPLIDQLKTVSGS